MPLFRIRCARLARIIGALVAAVLVAGCLAACSAIKLAYNNLPEVSYWWLDSYVDFDSTQTPRVRDGLTQLLEWHRQNELPKVVDLLRQTRTLAGDDVTPAQACELVESIQARLLAVAERAVPASSELALSLDDAQLGHLERKYARINADYRKEWIALTPKDQQEKRYEQFLDRSEDFYGRLDPSQRDLLRRQIAQSSFDPREIDANRKTRQQEIIALLRRLQAEKAAPAEAQAAVRAYVLRVAEPTGPVRLRREALQEESCRNIAELHNQTTAAQRSKARQRLQGYEDDLRELASSL
ncbi:DUF6279 family lipoprotein [Variovorax sp. Sphag1AA]|uniref:DUF6279 family lipoprotein n=1 Tax=Variovorax sp. Sphag1AA TaxID=2587027 RepID=UPI0017A7DECA|nr:DUF6279 family lipoprotein [Variovorax sp. Sphag1AA]MBB3177168.1 hypothetical protein [Variovorax sp. Sphag1AA]